MSALHQARFSGWARVVAVLLGVLSLCACSVLGQATSPPPSFYALDGAPTSTAQPEPGTVPGAKLTLIISPPQAASGFDSQRIVYLREAHHLEYFAHSEWVDTPARTLGPLLASAAQQTGAFAAVVLASGTAAGAVYTYQVPEPASLSLLVLGGLALQRRRK